MTAVVLWPTGGSYSPGGTGYVSPATCSVALNLQTTEASFRLPWRTAGVFSALYVRITTNSLTTATTYRFRSNGVDGNQTLSIAGGATGDFQDLTNTDTVAGAGEVLAIKVVVGTGGSFVGVVTGIVFAATTGTVTRYQLTGWGTTQAANLTRSQVLAGTSDASSTTATESREQFKVKSSGTLQNLYAVIPTNSLSTATTTIRSRVNGANGNCVVSIAAGATGLFEDITHNDSVVSGDLVNYVIVTASGGTGNLTHGNVGIELSTSDGVTYYDSATSATITVGAGATRYFPIAGNLQGTVTSEATVKGLAVLARTLSNLQIQMTANVPTGASTLRIRVNTANGNGVISIAGGATGYFEDASNTDSVAATDYLDYQLVVGSGTGNVTFNSVGCKVPSSQALTKTASVTRAPSQTVTRALTMTRTRAVTRAPSPAVARSMTMTRLASITRAPAPAAARALAMARAVSVTRAPSPTANRSEGLLRSASVTRAPSQSTAKLIGFSRTRSVTVAPAPTALRSLVLHRAASVTRAPSQVVARSLAMLRTASITRAPSPTVARRIGFFRSVAQTLAPAPLAARLGAFFRSASVTVAPTSHVSTATQGAGIRSASVTVHPSASATRRLAATRTAALTLGPSPTASRRLVLNRRVSLTLGPSPTASRRLGAVRHMIVTRSPLPVMRRSLSVARAVAVAVLPAPVAAQSRAMARAVLVSVGPNPTALRLLALRRAASVTVSVLASVRRRVRYHFVDGYTFDVPARSTEFDVRPVANEFDVRP